MKRTTSHVTAPNIASIELRCTRLTLCARTLVLPIILYRAIAISTMRLCCPPASLVILCAVFVEALPRQQVLVPPRPPQPRPLVIWHGMGDTYCAPGILEFIDMIKQMHPGIFVHSIYINEKEDEDRKAGWVSLCRHLTSKNVLRLLVTGMNTRSSGTLLSRLQM